MTNPDAGKEVPVFLCIFFLIVHERHTAYTKPIVLGVSSISFFI